MNIDKIKTLVVKYYYFVIIFILIVVIIFLVLNSFIYSQTKIISNTKLEKVITK